MPTVKAWREGITTGRPAMTSATGDAETDSLIGIAPAPVVSSAIAKLLGERAAEFAPYRTNTKDMKPDDLANARSIDRTSRLSDAIIAGTANRNTVGGAQAAAAGKDLFRTDSSGAVLDQFGGQLDTNNPMAGSTINLRKEQAGAQKANAAQSYAAADNSRASAAKTRDEMAAGARSRDIQTVTSPDGAVYLVNKLTGESRQAVDSNGMPVLSGKGGATGAKAGGGKPMTEGQAKANMFGGRMEAANKIFDELEAKDVRRPGFIKEAAQGVAGAVPIIGDSLAAGAGRLTNWTQSAPQQQIEQAQRDFINAVLRRESGAVIAEPEFANAAQQYFPQPGDSRAVIEQKRRNRERVTRLMMEEVPEHHRNAKPAQPANTGPRRISSDAEYDALPPGSEFIGPDGMTRRKP